jgi:hypothetical protein
VLKNLSLLDSTEIFLRFFLPQLKKIALSAIFEDEGGKRPEKIFEDKELKFFNTAYLVN